MSTILRKAIERSDFGEFKGDLNDLWKLLMLEPKDFSHSAIFNKSTKSLMNKMEFEHGGKEYDEKYPEGIPTSIQITLRGILINLDGSLLDSKLVMFPTGHAKNLKCDLKGILNHKFKLLGSLALNDIDLKEFSF